MIERVLLQMPEITGSTTIDFLIIIIIALGLGAVLYAIIYYLFRRNL